MKMFVLLSLTFILLQPGIAAPETPTDALTFSGRPKIKAAVMHDPPYTIKNEDGSWTGFNIDAWAEVAHRLGVDYDLVEMRIDEIIDALTHKTIDICVTALLPTPEREELFEFSTPLGSVRLALATLPNKIESPWWSAVRILISWAALKVVVVLLLLFVVVGSIFWRVERNKNPEHFGDGPIKGIGAGIYWVGSVLASGVCFGISLKSLTGRIMGLVWMFICTVVLSTFVASLTTSLTINRLEAPSVDRSNLRTMTLGVVKGGVSESIVKSMNIRYRVFGDEREVLDAIVDKVVDGYLYDEASLRYYEETLYTEMIEIHPAKLRGIIFAFALPHGSPLRRPMNIALLTLMRQPAWESLIERHGLLAKYEELPIKKRRGR